MSGFTPGPWVADAIADNGDIRIGHAEKPFVIASAHNAVSMGHILWGEWPKEQWANARLIAASPCLLDATIRLRQHLALFCSPTDAVAAEIFTLANAAIARARGQTP